MKIGFVGIGNMGGAIMYGYIEASEGKADICAFDLDEAKMAAAVSAGVKPLSSIGEVVKESDITLLCLKPQTFDSVIDEIAGNYDNSKLMISIAAGISIAYLEKHLGEGSRVVRVLPNTPAFVGEGMTAVFPGTDATDEDLAFVCGLFESIGAAEVIDEELIHCSIGVSGSSPAYTYMYIQALAEAAVENGMTEAQARKFAAQSVKGAAEMVLETEESLEQLRINVCSPNGTTIEAVEKYFENGMMDIIKEGFMAALNRSIEMTK